MRLLTLMAALAISTTTAMAQTPAVKSPNANNLQKHIKTNAGMMPVHVITRT